MRRAAPVCQKAASEMKKEDKIFVLGCLAHGLNLFLKSLYKEMKPIEDIFKNTSTIVHTINDHTKLRAYYTTDVRPKFQIGTGLPFSVETRWYTTYTQGSSVLINKQGLQYLLDEEYEFLKTVLSREHLKDFEEIVNNASFWRDLKFVTEKIMAPAKAAIDKFEADESSNRYVIQHIFRFISLLRE